ncbi:hypothetical protein AncyloWKF20_20850 [Ancylobacter sp. WKF20]|uniref:hypothetical protein n=1 Tax=Ancylobacter sp. WKF20 TaxID=3039801 RepID=UPI002434179A|nr:hypothetical protein [Ancylobacter sp. WKF20]WGD30165.1 hypothetical protein AncyloWKF20_20850 [Ancylobacter sp. WKF20]
MSEKLAEETKFLDDVLSLARMASISQYHFEAIFHRIISIEKNSVHPDHDEIVFKIRQELYDNVSFAHFDILERAKRLADRAKELMDL